MINEPGLSAVAESTGDRDKFNHLIPKNMVHLVGTGLPLVAICGVYWVPVELNGSYPICPDCAKQLELIKRRDRGRRGFN